MRRCDRKCLLSVILRHLSVNIFATKYVIFYRILWRHSWSKMHHLRHVRFDWHPFCISECIGPESFSAWNLTWHHQIYCFRTLRHVRFGRWAMHRMQIAGARIGALMQIAKSNLLWRNEAFDSSQGGKDIWICKHYMQMRQLKLTELLIIYSRTNYYQEEKWKGSYAHDFETRSNRGL
jgi:hypothetical protein